MNRDQFFFHDLSHFPIVTAKHGGPDGYSASWIREMEMLVNNPQPFVLVVPDMRQEAGHEDRKAMVEWQTTNMPRLRARCRAFIAVERDAEALEKIRKRAEKMARAFDMPFLAVASATEAMQCAREVLGQAGRRLQPELKRPAQTNPWPGHRPGICNVLRGAFLLRLARATRTIARELPKPGKAALGHRSKSSSSSRP